MDVRFTWSEKKASLDKRKHGISFETAIEVFDDPNQYEEAIYAATQA
jgi:uncharacterized DUF497 family protein